MLRAHSSVTSALLRDPSNSTNDFVEFSESPVVELGGIEPPSVW